MIRVELQRDQVANSEHVTGQAVWNSEGGKQPRKIDVICRWRMEGKKNDAAVVDLTVEERIEGRSQIVVPFDFEIPFAGPLTYSGKLFSFIWEIVARADMPFASDEVDTKVFVVKPTVWTVEQFQQWQDAWNDDDEEDDEEEAEAVEAGETPP